MSRTEILLSILGPAGAVLVGYALLEGVLLLRRWALRAVNRRRARHLQINPPGRENAIRSEGRWW